MSVRQLYKSFAAVGIGCLLFMSIVATMRASQLDAPILPSLAASLATSLATVEAPEGNSEARLRNSYLQNANFECQNGVYQVADSSGQLLTIPNNWVWTPISGTPKLISTRIQVTGDCGGSGFVDRLEGEDSFMIRSADIETPPVPGKPFDVAIYQQVSVTVGSDYSVSGFMTSLCGGSASPNDCPPGYYISKMVGLDPTGGTDPLADSVVWVENREPHTSAGYANLYVSATAASSTMTVFIRVHSPFQWHGNHAIIDLFSMVEAPSAQLVQLPERFEITGTMGIPSSTHVVQGRSYDIRWDGALSPDIEALDGEDYQLNTTVQVRQLGSDEWTTLAENQSSPGCQVFVAPALNRTYYFRTSALANRPTTGGHRYPTVWSEPVAIHFMTGSQGNSRSAAVSNGGFTNGGFTNGTFGLYLPVINGPISLVCD